MKRGTRNRVLVVLAVVWTMNSMPVLAATGGKPAFVPTNRAQPFSDRLIVKLRPSKAIQSAQVMSVSQIRAELSRPFSAEVIQQLHAAAGAPVTDLRATVNGAHVMTLSGVRDRQAVVQAIAGISKLPNVEYVEEDRIETIQAIPNDTNYGLLWAMQPVSAVAGTSSGWTGNYGADFETAWNTTAGSGVVVAVVDTGITAHPDIVGASAVIAAGPGSNLVSAGYDFIRDCRIRGTTSAGGCPANTPTASAVVAASPGASDTGDYISSQDVIDNPTLFPAASSSSWHGTHVAGTIAALGNNSLGVIGGAYNAKILPLRVLGKGGGYSSDVSDAIMWAAGGLTVGGVSPNPNPARVINLSLGSTAPSCGITRQNAINAAVGAGAVVVVAAGNENADVATSTSANCQNVISVAAVGRDGSRATYSNFSSPSSSANPVHVTLAAQGSDISAGTPAPTFDRGIYSTVDSGTTTPLGSGYAYYQGTSMATPHVSAAVALMLALNPALTPVQVKTILSSPASLTAFPSFGSGWASWDCSLNRNCGAGILNAKLAVQNSALPLLVGTLDFGTVGAYSGGNNLSVTLTNVSGTPVTTTSSVLSGPNAAMFTVISNTCDAATIPAAGTCQVTANYAPTSLSAHSATLTINAATATTAGIVSLTGKSGAALQPGASSVTATTVTVGQSTTVTLSFNNPNTVPETTGALAFSQPAIMAASSDSCSNVTLAAGASCGVTVNITPVSAGSYSGTASLALATGSNPSASVLISGTANPAPVAASSGGGGGGCSVMPFGAEPDASLLLAMLAVAAYWLRRRAIRSTW